MIDESQDKLKDENYNTSLSKTKEIDEELEWKIKENGKGKRGEWGSRFEFILCCVGTAVGLGNIWRFPYLCYKNGGGAFLIPYTITLCFIGLPLFFMELALGQFASIGPIGIWSISPMFKGLGYGMVFISGLTCIYYNIIIAQCMYYFGVSFTSYLPWANCNNSWNNASLCYDGMDNSTNSTLRVSPSEEYYDNYVLNISSSIEDFGLPQWKILVCFVVAWIIVIIILLKGIKIMGKVSYFTALFPYILLTILLVRGVLLPGSLNGILYYVKPNFTYLKYPDVWIEAATQIFFSLSVCNGSLIAISSYNRFKNNCLRDAVLVAVINCATSVYGGFVIFSNLGFMAHMKNVSVAEVVKGGPGLAFKVYPEALNKMPLSPLWSVLFFMMMLILGIGSQIGLVEAVLVGFQDLLSNNLLKSENRKILYRVAMCFLLFCIGVPMTCRGGMYLLEIFDGAVGGCAVLILAFVEIVVICYCYGIERFRKDIKLMTKHKPNLYWKYCWMYICPVLLLFLIIALIIFSFLKKSKLSNGFLALQIVLSIIPIVSIIGVFATVYCRNGGWLLFTELKKPLEVWGPTHFEHNRTFRACIESNTGVNDFFQSKEKIAEKFKRHASVIEDPSNSTPQLNLTTLVEI